MTGNGDFDNENENIELLKKLDDEVFLSSDSFLDSLRLEK